MKKSFIYLCLFAFISSCSSNILEEVQSIPKSRSIGYEPTWWNSTERLPAPSEYWSGYRDTPYDVATIDTCAGYVSLVYSWGFSYDWQYYHRLQVQYRKISDGDEYLQFIPESEWKWLGDGKGKYQNGIIEEKSPSRCVDIDAACLPKGKIGIRYRLLHMAYPGQYYDPGYDNIMYTEWTMVSRSGMVIMNEGGSFVEQLFIHVSFPQTMAMFTCSVFIDDNQIYKNTNNIYVYERKKENGTYTVSAFMQIHQGRSTEYRSAEKTGEYNKSTKHIYVNFTLEDFVY